MLKKEALLMGEPPYPRMGWTGVAQWLMGSGGPIGIIVSQGEVFGNPPKVEAILDFRESGNGLTVLPESNTDGYYIRESTGATCKVVGGHAKGSAYQKLIDANELKKTVTILWRPL